MEYQRNTYIYRHVFNNTLDKKKLEDTEGLTEVLSRRRTDNTTTKRENR